MRSKRALLAWVACASRLPKVPARVVAKSVLKNYQDAIRACIAIPIARRCEASMHEIQLHTHNRALMGRQEKRFALQLVLGCSKSVNVTETLPMPAKRPSSTSPGATAMSPVHVPVLTTLPALSLIHI